MTEDVKRGRGRPRKNPESVTNSIAEVKSDQELNPAVDEITKPELNPRIKERDDFISGLAKNRAEERDNELKEADMEVADTSIEPEKIEAEVAPTSNDMTPEPEEAKTAEAKTPEVEMVTLNVMGELRQVPKDKIYDEGIRALQKEGAADKKLDEASRLLKEAKEVEQRIKTQVSPDPVRQAPSEPDELALARAIQLGSEDEAVNAIRSLKGRQIDPLKVVAAASAQVKAEIESENAFEWFKSEYKEVMDDPYLTRIAATRWDEVQRELQSRNEHRPLKEVYKGIGEEIRKWKSDGGKTSINVAPDKQAAKATIVNLPSANAKKVDPEQPKPLSASQIIEKMREKRVGSLN